MSIPLMVRDFRLSFIWSELLLDLIDGKSHPTAAFAFLAQGNLYKETFEASQRRQHPLRLEPPWEEKKSQRFWKRYLPGAVLDSVGGKQAWECLVPFRSRPPFRVKESQNQELSLEGFYYPHCLAVVITARCLGKFSLDDATKLAYVTKHSQKFTVETNGQSQMLGLGALAQEMFDSLGTPALGSPARGLQREPFTVFTLVRGEGDGVSSDIEQNKEIQTALEVITRWPPNPAAINVPPLSDVVIASHELSQRLKCPELSGDAPTGSVIYVHRHGRALWCPGFFTSQNTSLTSLACYHRNQVFGSMQVECMGSMVAAAAAQLRNGVPLANMVGPPRACAENACKCLERIHGGDKRVTYASLSLKKQIQENDLADLNELRHVFWPASLALT